MIDLDDKNRISNAGKAYLRLENGAHLSKYRLKRCLGTDGASEVWRARDSVEGIWVALKIPLTGFDGIRDNRVLLWKIRAVSQLRHPNIFAVKNAGVKSSIPGMCILSPSFAESVKGLSI